MAHDRKRKAHEPKAGKNMINLSDNEPGSEAVKRTRDQSEVGCLPLGYRFECSAHRAWCESY